MAYEWVYIAIRSSTSIHLIIYRISAPYNYLKKNNYILSIDDEVKNTSLFKNHPDNIWFKDKFEQKDYKYIDLLSNDLSDHNGIYVELKLK